MKSDRALRRVVALVLFVNAFLVFVLQPHISKRLLPVLGGSAEVWIVCTLFFQLALLAGYSAAYFARRLPLATSLTLHVILGGVAWLLWPFVAGDGPPLDASPPMWTLQSLVTASRAVVHRLDGDLTSSPNGYRACGAEPGSVSVVRGEQCRESGRPVLVSGIIEPTLSLNQQASAWSAAALGLLVLLGVAALGLAGRRTQAKVEEASPAPLPRQRLRWLVLSLVPSTLLLAATAQITTDIAPVPLLWMLPLGLYLGSFILVFSHGWKPSRWTWAAMAVFSLPMLLAFTYEPNQWWWVGVHLTILWCGAVLCHGALVMERPSPDRLAEFYLWLAMGGALGGLLGGLVAPLVFDTRAEYPLAVLAVLWLAPGIPIGAPQLRLSRGVAIGLATIGVLAAIGLAWATAAPPGVANVFVLVPAVVAVGSWHRPRVFASCASLALLAIVVGNQFSDDGVILRGRTFYGTHSVRELRDASARALFHGTTLHGLQSLRPGRTRDPLSYYGPASPVADVFREWVGDRARVAVIGLGAGVILRYAQPGSEWTIYEIDPAIARLAQDATLFSHWTEAAVVPTLVIGDGRLRLREAADASYDLIVVDAFASDSIPLHLLSKEVMALYTRKLRDGGAVLFNISNRYLELTPVIGATALPLGLVAYERADQTHDMTAGLFPSRWVMVGKGATLTAPTPEWHSVEVLKNDRGWTDDYSNVFAVLRPVRLVRELIAAAWDY